MIVTAIALAFLLPFVFLVRHAIGGHGCRLFSVNEYRYVAHNEEIFKTIRLPPGAVEANSYSIGIPAPNACSPAHENGPPYSAFDTWHNFTIVPPLRRGAVDFYRRILPPQWTVTFGSGTEETFYRGKALLYVNGGRDRFIMSIDYLGGDGAGH